MKMLVVEDDFKIRTFLASGLQQHGFVVDQAENGEEGFSLLTTEKYDAAIVDVMLPKLDGLTLVERVRACGVHTPLLVLSSKGTVQERVAGLQRGADDYLVKPFVFAEVLARIQAILRRGKPLKNEHVLGIADLTVDLRAHEVRRSGKLIALQPREFSLLCLLMQNAGHIVSKTMILEQVWDYHFDPQTSVIDVLVCRLRAKIDRNSELKLIHTIRGGGYAIKES